MPASIFESSANLPFGNVTIPINGTDYLVTADNMPLYAESRTMSRTNSKGTVADVIVALSSEPNSGGLTVQRESTSTPIPTRGDTFSSDWKQIGVTASFVITNVNIIRSTDAMDELELSLVQTDNLRGQANYPGDDAY